MALDRQYWLLDLLLLVFLTVLLRVVMIGHLSPQTGETWLNVVSTDTRALGMKEMRPGIDQLHEWFCYQVQVHGNASLRSLRLFSTAAGTLVSIWLFLWSAHWFGPWPGSAAALIYALWPCSVAWGALAAPVAFEQLLYFLIVVSAWKRLEKNELGHPVMELPYVGGRQSPWTRARHFLPLALLAVVFAWLGGWSEMALVFLPVYLFLRLVWAFVRGGTDDYEFQRSITYLLTFTVMLVLLTGLVSASRVAEGELPAITGWMATLPWLTEKLGLTFFPAVLLGSVLIVRRHRPGWLCVCAFWGPLLVVPFMPSTSQYGVLGAIFPFGAILAGLPLAWSLEVIRDTINEYTRVRLIKWHRALPALALAGCAFAGILYAVILAEGGTSDLLAGGRTLNIDYLPD